MATTTRAALHTPLCDLLGIRYPICQAGMGWVARSSLAAAVSTAGGLGVIAAAHGTPEHLRDEIRRVRDLTDKPFGVDVLFATIRAAGDEVEQFTDQVKGWVDVTLEERAPVLVAGLGNPGPVTAQDHKLGMKVMALCGNVKQARDHARNGVDVVIAQGHEAGGHTGRIGGMVLIPAVVDAVSPTPVVAAGGIADGRGVAAALALGAVGVWMGTRFIATHEAYGHDTTRRRSWPSTRKARWCIGALPASPAGPSATTSRGSGKSARRTSSPSRSRPSAWDSPRPSGPARRAISRTAMPPAARARVSSRTSCPRAT